MGITPPKPKAELPAESEVLYITWHGWESPRNPGAMGIPTLCTSNSHTENKVSALPFPL